VEAFKTSGEPLKEMTWLIVGGEGQFGKAIAFVLRERGIEFRALGSGALDIRSEVFSKQYVSDMRPSVIVNAAAWTDVDGAETSQDQAYAVNAMGAGNLAAAAKNVGAIFVHLSTDYVFSGLSEKPWQEDDLCAPTTIYGKSKLAGEMSVLKEYIERSYIFRTAWLYSSWGKNFAKTMTQLSINGDGEVRVVDDQIGQPTFAIDLAHQIIDTVFKSLQFGIFHGTNSGQGSWFDFAHEIFIASGGSIDRLVAINSSEIIRPAARPHYSVLGHEKWSSAGTFVAPMRDWRVALSEAMPKIISTIRVEG
jgi:dTDP-4-dehydrorhamnose reductase